MNAFAKAAKVRSVAHPSEIFYSQGGFGTLLNAAEHGNRNTNYYFVVNAPPGDKTAVRPESVYQQFAAAPNIHPVVEFNKAAWNKLPGTWQQKGREFRQEMAQAGLPANTMWAINEAGSGIRAKSPQARRQMSALTTALAAIGNGQKERGLVFQQGPGYKQGLQSELADSKFWNAMKGSVWRYMPETYISPKAYLGMQAQQRQQYLFGADKGLAKPEFGPMMSAFYGATKGYGNTKVPLPEMRKFVAAQLAQVRAKGQPVFGMAWNGASGLAPKAQAALARTIVR